MGDLTQLFETERKSFNPCHLSIYDKIGKDCNRYSNYNYQPLPSDVNENVDSVLDYEDLCEEFDSKFRSSQKGGNESRRRYAQLDSISMGVEQHADTLPRLHTEKNLNMTIGSDKKACVSSAVQEIDDSDHDRSNKMKINVDHALASVCKIHNIPTSANEFSKGTEDITLPSGWEKHEDDSGPYYWHVNSGTIQREPPLSEDIKAVLANNVKRMSMIPSINNFSLDSKNPMPLSEQECNNLMSVSENKSEQKSNDANSSNPPHGKGPIRFAVRSLGWVEISEEELTPEKSSKAVNKCIVDLSMGRKDILDVVGRWGDGKNLFMDLDDCSLRLIDTQNFTVLNSQSIHTIRVWGVGRDNGRDFAYVAKDSSTRKYMCHVFRCDIPARVIANALRDICKRVMSAQNLQQNMSKNVFTRQEYNGVKNFTFKVSTNLENFGTEEKLMLDGKNEKDCEGFLFPTPMEEPKKVLKAYYLGNMDVDKATGVEVLNDAIGKLCKAMPLSAYKCVTVSVAPSTITISELGECGKLLEECRIRFLSFLGIGKDIKYCGFIVHTSEDKFVAHVFYCEPSSGALCKTIEAACKLRYQKCLDSHKKVQDNKSTKSQENKGFATAIRSIFGSIGRLSNSEDVDGRF